MIYSNNTDPVLKELSAEYSSRDIRVMFGFRIRDKKLTDELCLMFVVKNKLPLDQLTSEEILPSSVIIDNKHYPTDVIEISNITTAACPAPCVSWQTTPPGNRNTVRPLKGGLSIGSKNNISGTDCIKGTLGFIAVDAASQALVGVTTAHIVVKNPFITVDQDLTKVAQNEKDNYVYQTGETCVANPALQIGQVIRYAPLYTPPPPPSDNDDIFYFYLPNYVDGALISLNPADVSNTESFKQYGLNYNLPLPFATSNEIWNLDNTNPKVYISGRTTGAQGEGSCELGYIGIFNDYFLVNGYNLQGVDSTSMFSNAIMFISTNQECVAIAPGDSGSALIAEIGGVRKIIGLVFAQGMLNGTVPIGLACRIDWVAEQLGIEAWDGTPKNFIDPASIEYATVPGKSIDSAIRLNNKVYWQIGLSDSSIGTTTTSTTILGPSTTTSTTTAPIGINTVYVKYSAY